MIAALSPFGCMNDVSFSSATSSLNFCWTPSAGLSNIFGSDESITSTYDNPITENTYTRIASDPSTGCINIDQRVVNPKLTNLGDENKITCSDCGDINTTFPQSNLYPLCLETMQTLTTTIVASSYSWSYYDDNAGEWVDLNVYNQFVDVFPSDVTTYRVKAQNYNACTYAYFTIIVGPYLELDKIDYFTCKIDDATWGVNGEDFDADCDLMNDPNCDNKLAMPMNGELKGFKPGYGANVTNLTDWTWTATPSDQNLFHDPNHPDDFLNKSFKLYASNEVGDFDVNLEADNLIQEDGSCGTGSSLSTSALIHVNEKEDPGLLGYRTDHNWGSPSGNVDCGTKDILLFASSAPEGSIVTWTDDTKFPGSTLQSTIGTTIIDDDGDPNTTDDPTLFNAVRANLFCPPRSPSTVTYTATIFSSCCCAKSEITLSTDFRLENPAIENSAENGLQLKIDAMPNPVNDMIKVNISATDKENQSYTFEVEDLYGHSLMKKQITLVDGYYSEWLPLSLPSGIYLLRAYNSNQQGIKTIMVSH